MGEGTIMISKERTYIPNTHMDKQLRDLIEDQINKELWSAYIYLDMAEFYQAKGLHGLHAWFEKQAKEEVEHAEKFMEFLHDRDESFRLKPIEAPNKVYKDLREPLAYQLEHEKLVTSLILAIYNKAKEVGDPIVSHFMAWYVNEQVEEEGHSKELLDQFDLFAKDGGLGLHEFDKDCGKAVK